MNVCFEPDAAAADFFAGLERELVDRLAAKSAHEPNIFNKALARPEIEARMQSCLKTSQRGSSFLKAKLNWERVRFQAECPSEAAGRYRKGEAAGRSPALPDSVRPPRQGASYSSRRIRLNLREEVFIIN